MAHYGGQGTGSTLPPLRTRDQENLKRETLYADGQERFRLIHVALRLRSSVGDWLALSMNSLTRHHFT